MTQTKKKNSKGCKVGDIVKMGGTEEYAGMEFVLVSDEYIFGNDRFALGVYTYTAKEMAHQREAYAIKSGAIDPPRSISVMELRVFDMV